MDSLDSHSRFPSGNHLPRDLPDLPQISVCSRMVGRNRPVIRATQSHPGAKLTLSAIVGLGLEESKTQ